MVSRRRTTNRVTRPLEQRAQLYAKVAGLYTRGLRRREIVREMRRRFGVSMEHSQVINWTERGVSPYGRAYKFEAIPSPELAYVIGAKLGDATRSRSTWHHNFMIKLLVTDKEFADEFSRCASTVLHCRPFKVWWYGRRRAWNVTVNSIMLFRFLRKGLRQFQPHVEHCDSCVSAFLRGFFDAEGTSSGGYVSCSNTNLQLLTYVKKLLKSRFSVETTGPRKKGLPPGSRVLIKGRWYNVNKQGYYLRVRSKSNSRFAELVGFSIRRKQRQIMPGRAL